MSSNPYTPPRAVVRDLEDAREFQEVRLWSASGRIGRLRYLAYTTGASLLAGIAAAALAAVLGQSMGMMIAVLVYIVTIVFCVLAAIQRSHDMDWNGWTVLLTIIPFVGLIWIFKSGSADTNTYGAPPPPNTIGVKILGLLLPIIFIIGIVSAIALPAYISYTQRAAGG